MIQLTLKTSKKSIQSTIFKDSVLSKPQQLTKTSRKSCRPPQNPQLTFLLLIMAFSRRLQVISTGTIFPLTIQSSIRPPNSDPSRHRSSRSKSPADKCLNPKLSTIFSHCVPFPAPRMRSKM